MAIETTSYDVTAKAIGASGEGYYDRWEARRMGELVLGGHYRFRVVMPS